MNIKNRFKARLALCAVLIVSQIGFLAFNFFPGRRAKAPVKMQTWQPLSERSLEEREKIVATFFALDDFDIKPASSDSKFVTIPRAVKWMEQMIVSTTVSLDKEGDETADDAKSKDAKTPVDAGSINLHVTSISVSAYETEKMPEGNLISMKEKILSRDAYETENGNQRPPFQIHFVGRYTVNVKEDALQSIARTMIFDGKLQLNLTADVPHWLVPTRQVAIGETWVQLGVNPDSVANKAPRPEVVGTVNRLVTFEGRQAAEISSTSTGYDFSRGPAVPPKKRIEERLCYFDLETGEPLWYECKSKDEGQTGSVIRGFNQILNNHFVRTIEK